MSSKSSCFLEKHRDYQSNYHPNYTVLLVLAHTLFSNSVQLPKNQCTNTVVFVKFYLENSAQIRPYLCAVSTVTVNSYDENHVVMVITLTT